MRLGHETDQADCGMHINNPTLAFMFEMHTFLPSSAHERTCSRLKASFDSSRATIGASVGTSVSSR